MRLGEGHLLPPLHATSIQMYSTILYRCLPMVRVGGCFERHGRARAMRQPRPCASLMVSARAKVLLHVICSISSEVGRSLVVACVCMHMFSVRSDAPGAPVNLPLFIRAWAITGARGLSPSSELGNHWWSCVCICADRVFSDGYGFAFGSAADTPSYCLRQ